MIVIEAKFIATKAARRRLGGKGNARLGGATKGAARGAQLTPSGPAAIGLGIGA